ncbi:MAG: C40 family peptidase [Notoacmeibacter sp.]|nr:C40 family peptidase [Notoacmeibacter sp.]
MTALDPRLHAFRPDLADARLRGQVEASAYVEGKPARITVPVADVRRAGDPMSGLDTQFLLGEHVTVFDSRAGWSWVQGRRDGYVGYLRGAEIGPVSLKPSHEVAVPRTFAYVEPDMKRPVARALSMGGAVTVSDHVETRGTLYAVTDDGEAIVASHLRAVGQNSDDYVTVAETLLGAPYLWGGTSGFGVDCSGLVQLAMRMAGRTVLRDTPMQEATLGEPIDPGVGFENLRRGDLVFWTGHVGIMADGKTLLHASGSAMMVVREPLAGAIARITPINGSPTCCRRP